MAVLELNDVHYTYETQYQKTDALKGISCSFEEGTMYALMGKSGSGKTTLLSLMAGLDLPTQGEIKAEGISTADMDLKKYRREKAAVIYQNFRLFPLLTAAENVMFPMELRGVDAKSALEEAKRLIAKVSLPESVCDRYPTMLSGGEQQRVAIARALGMRTKLLLADEPTGNLDTANSENIIHILQDLAHHDGYCVIVVTHDEAFGEQADVKIRLTDGEVTSVERKTIA